MVSGIFYVFSGCVSFDTFSLFVNMQIYVIILYFVIIIIMIPVKRICVFEHSVMTNFNCACPAIQRGQGSGFLSEGSS